jgi:maltooligosyltrehalose trehalohydrolase
MGEEYGEVAPFWYFVSHSDPALIEAVRKGRLEEFAAFQWPGEPPDPMDEETFFRARLDHGLCQTGEHRVLLDFYRELLRLRQELNLLTDLGRQDRDVQGFEKEKVLRVRMNGELAQAVILAHFGQEPLAMSLFWPEGDWRKRLDSAETPWGGPGSQTPPVIQGNNDINLRLPPRSLMIYLRKDSC